jgi:hypothetical protein
VNRHSADKLSLEAFLLSSLVEKLDRALQEAAGYGDGYLDTVRTGGHTADYWREHRKGSEARERGAHRSGQPEREGAA